MNAKNNRQQLIMKLVAQGEIRTQRELVSKLKKLIPATQATVGRDIRELRLVKLQTDSGAFYYSARKSTVGSSKEKPFVKASRMKNIINLEVESGYGSVIKFYLRNKYAPLLFAILNTGNTVLMVLRDEKSAIMVYESL